MFVVGRRGIRAAIGGCSSLFHNFISLNAFFLHLFAFVLPEFHLKAQIFPLELIHLWADMFISLNDMLKLLIGFSIILILPGNLFLQKIDIFLVLVILFNKGMNILNLVLEVILQLINLWCFCFQFNLNPVIFGIHILELGEEVLWSVGCKDSRDLVVHGLA